MKSKSLIVALGATLGLSLAACTNSPNPFQAEKMDSGYANAEAHAKAGHGKCGKGKCGKGKCGAEMKKAKMHGKCGKGKCGAEMKAKKHHHHKKASSTSKE